MFKRKPAEPTALDREIADVHEQLANTDYANSDEYHDILEKLERLYKIKAEERPDRVKRDTMFLVAGNVVVTAMVVGHERAHVITSKALNFVQKLR